jgi:hypothetical protein
MVLNIELHPLIGIENDEAGGLLLYRFTRFNHFTMQSNPT